jgi:hypothetical protein
MKVKILVEFEVEPAEYEDGRELTENYAKGAASMAAWHHLCLTLTGVGVAEDVVVHADGFGDCRVRIGEEHE